MSLLLKGWFDGKRFHLSYLKRLTKGKVKINIKAVLKIMRILGRLPGTFFQWYEVLS